MSGIFLQCKPINGLPAIWIEQLYTDIAATAKLPLEDLALKKRKEKCKLQTNTMIFQNYFFSVQEVESIGLCRFHHL